MANLINNASEFFKRIKLELDLNVSDLNEALNIFVFDDIKDKLVIFIHLIMLQNKFRYLDDDRRIEQNKTKIYSNLKYNSVENVGQLDANIVITILRSSETSNKADIHIKYKSFSSQFLKVDDMPNVLTNERAMKKFQLDFKNYLLVALKFSLRHIDELVLISGLNDMPCELIIKLCRNFLDIKSIVRLARTSKHLNKIIFSDLNEKSSLWYKLVNRDFKNRVKNETMSTPNYLQMYKLFQRTFKF